MTKKEMHEIRSELPLYDEDEELTFEDWVRSLKFAERCIRNHKVLMARSEEIARQEAIDLRKKEEEADKIRKVLSDYYGDRSETVGKNEAITLNPFE